MAIQDTLAELRAQYPTPLGVDKVHELLNRTAWIHRADGWGLLLKPSGNSYNGYAVDILFNRVSGHHFDVISDAGGQSGLAWQDDGPMDLARWSGPVAPPDETTPAPVEPPVVPVEEPTIDIGLGELIATIKALIDSNAVLAKTINDKQFSVKLRL